MNPTVVSGPLAVSLPTSGTSRSHGVTGGVYKTRERIHRDMLIRDRAGVGSHCGVLGNDRR